MREETEELLQGKFKILRELYKNGQSVGDTVLPYFNAEVNKLYKLYIFRTFKNIKVLQNYVLCLIFNVI